MTPLFALVLVGSLAVAGCTDSGPADGDGGVGEAGPCLSQDDDPGSGAHSWEIWKTTVEADGPFRIGVPVPVSSPGTEFGEWVRNLTWDGNVDLSTDRTIRGRVIVLDGRGDAQACSSALQHPMRGNRCCAEAYLDAEWTTNSSRSTEVVVRVEEPPARVEIRYDARSGYCSREAAFDAGDPAEPWTPAAGDDSAVCA